MRSKEEPIDVDELFSDVEEVQAPENGYERRSVRKRMRKRMRNGTGRRVVSGTSAQPIDLVSEEEVETVSRPCVNANAGLANAGSVAGVGPTPLDGIAAHQALMSGLAAFNQAGPSILPADMDTNGSRTSLGQPRRPLLGLASPIPTPSVSPPTSIRGHNNADAARPLISPTRSAVSVHVRHEVKMDVDSELGGLPLSVPDDYSSDEEYWGRSSDVEMDIDLEGEGDGQLDMNATLEALERTHERAPSHHPIRSRTLLRAETATLRIPPDPRPSRRRIWDIFKLGYPMSRYVPLRTDYSRLVRRDGVLSRGTRSRGVFNCRLNVPPPRSSSVFKQTSGSINKIVQSGDFVAVASPTSGGGVDQSMAAGAPEVDPYNKEGNLIVWRGDKNILLDGHSRSWPGGDGNLHGLSKYYTVNDVAFDPLVPNRLVSSGNDCTVRVVDLEICGETFSPKNAFTFTYPSKPYDIAYKPKSSVFAVSCWDGNMYIHQDNDCFALEVSDQPDVRPGTFLWGANSESDDGALSDVLFVSSESEREDVCRHRAFDVRGQRPIYELDINDSGDSMALDPQGSILALVTSKSDDKPHMLSLFDVARQDGLRCGGTGLHPLLPHARGSPQLHAPLEITHSAFSPDGRMLALARNDNTADVYDIRFLTSDPWAHLSHPFPDPTPNANEVERRREAEFFGVTGLYWVESFFSRGLGLVTGAADGCVRLWDVMRAPDHEKESMVLAEIDHDVVCFSVGDPSKNERKLVVGGYGGEVYFFD